MKFDVLKKPILIINDTKALRNCIVLLLHSD